MQLTISSSRLSERYYQAIYWLPPSLRVRKPLEEKAMGLLEQGKNICIRGFWRIGKTELMKAALERTCKKLKADGLVFDLRSERQADFRPKSADEVLTKIREQLETFYGHKGCNMVVDPCSPLESLGALDEPVFLGIDELVALESLPSDLMADIIKQIKEAPENVRLVLVCHRCRSVDDVFESEIVNDQDFTTLFVPPITDEELEYIVQAPGRDSGVSFSDSALTRLSELSGNKPWEVFTFCLMITCSLENQGMLRPGETIGRNVVDSTITLPNLAGDEDGKWVIDNYLRIFFSATTAREKEVMQSIALGSFTESEEYRKELEGLEMAGWVEINAVWRIKSSLFEEFIGRITKGEITVEQR